MEIILFVAGVIIGWVVTHIYSVRSNRDQQLLFNKLSAEIREYVLSDPRDQLTILELNKLLEEKTVDLSRRDPLPYVACPKCGSQNLSRGMAFDEKRDHNYYVIECGNCPWQEWTE